MKIIVFSREKIENENMKERPMMQKLSQCEENLLKKAGFQYIAGLDEAGRGPLAGPLVVAAVILPENYDIKDINDSKQLTSFQRLKLSEYIMETALAWCIKIASPKMVDKENIYQATKLCMQMAVRDLDIKPDFILIDALNINTPEIAQKSVIKGDTKIVSIAAASILAKVARDGIMTQYAKTYPQYGFDRHMGYGTKEHMEALDSHGPCPIHRYSFEPVKKAAQKHSHKTECQAALTF